MARKNIARTAAALAIVATGFGVLTVNAGPAEAARKFCLYKAYNPFSREYAYYVEGSAKAVKQSWACNRAERRCLTSLRRLWNIGSHYQYRCVRTR